MTYDRSQLAQLIHTKALRFGDFTLASGKKASFYLDVKQVTLDSVGAWLVGQGILERLQSKLPHAVGGMSIGADPITAAILAAAGAQGAALQGFMVRKEPKGHGTNQYIEGPVQPGQRVVIVEDVVTTGGSSLLAIDRAVEFGLQVEQVIAIVDRLQGGKEAFAARGLPLTTLFTIQDFGINPSP